MKGVSETASGEEARINFDWEVHNWRKLTQHESWVFELEMGVLPGYDRRLCLSFVLNYIRTAARLSFSVHFGMFLACRTCGQTRAGAATCRDCRMLRTACRV